jgi:hypothetical protein
MLAQGDAMTAKRCRPLKKPPESVWVTIEERDSLGHLRNVYYWTGSARAPRGHGAVSYRYVLPRAAKVTEAEVERLVKALIRRFDPSRQRFLVDYGFRQVIEHLVKLGARLPRSSREKR